MFAVLIRFLPSIPFPQDVLKQTRVALKKHLNKRDKWIKEWPGQMCITASQIQWTADITKVHPFSYIFLMNYGYNAEFRTQFRFCGYTPFLSPETRPTTVSVGRSVGPTLL